MKNQRPPTKTQRAVLEEFQRRAEAGDRAPSYRELSKLFGWRSPAAAQKHVAALAGKGLLSVDHLRPNGVRLPHLDKGVLGTVRHVERLDGRGHLGKVIQGIPLPAQLHPGDPCVAFNAEDDDRKALGVYEHDLIIARTDESGHGEQLVMVSKGGRPTVTSAARAARNGQQVFGRVRLVIRAFVDQP